MDIKWGIGFCWVGGGSMRVAGLCVLRLVSLALREVPLPQVSCARLLERVPSG